MISEYNKLYLFNRYRDDLLTALSISFEKIRLFHYIEKILYSLL